LKKNALQFIAHGAYVMHTGMHFISYISFLADRTATQYDRLGYWRNPVVCPSVTLCILALRVGVQG